MMRARKLVRLLSLAIPVAIGIAAVVIAVPRLGGDADQASAQIPTDIVVSLDMDTTDGGPCADIDSSATHAAGESYDVAICAEGLYGMGNAAIGVIVFDILYDDTLNIAPEVADTGKGLDDNPDANAGATFWGDGLGDNWDCSGGGVAYPEGDRNPASGPGNGDAFIACSSVLGPWTMGNDETSGVLAVVNFQAFAEGADTLTIANGILGFNDFSEMGTCNPDIVFPMACNGGEDSKSGTQPLTVSLDMDTTDGGPCADIDSYAGHRPGESYDVAICVDGLAPGDPVAAFSFDVLYDDTLNEAPELADTGKGLDDNPDANAGATFWGDSLGGGWDCTVMGLAYPVGDRNPASGPGNGDAFISCLSIIGPWTLGDDETSGVLAVINFQALAEGSDNLTIVNGILASSDASEMGTCNPEDTQPMACHGGEDIKSGPTVTPTPTQTATPAETPTPTQTPTPTPPPDADGDGIVDTFDTCPWLAED